MPPDSCRNAEYCTCQSVSASASLDVTYAANFSASGPVISNSPMCETSNSPAPSRTPRCSAVMPAGDCTGISKPANGTIFAPAATCIAWKGVFFSASAVFSIASLPPHQVHHQCLLRVEAVLGLVEYLRLRALDHRVRHFLAPVRRKAVEKNRAGLRQLHQLLVDAVALERHAPLLGFLFLAHGRPHVGVDDVRALGRFLGILGDEDLRRPAGAVERRAVGLVLLGAGEPQLEA